MYYFTDLSPNGKFYPDGMCWDKVAESVGGGMTEAECVLYDRIKIPRLGDFLF